MLDDDDGGYVGISTRNLGLPEVPGTVAGGLVGGGGPAGRVQWPGGGGPGRVQWPGGGGSDGAYVGISIRNLGLEVPGTLAAASGLVGLLLGGDLRERELPLLDVLGGGDLDLDLLPEGGGLLRGLGGGSELLDELDGDEKGRVKRPLRVLE